MRYRKSKLESLESRRLLSIDATLVLHLTTEEIEVARPLVQTFHHEGEFLLTIPTSKFMRGFQSDGTSEGTRELEPIEGRGFSLISGTTRSFSEIETESQKFFETRRGEDEALVTWNNGAVVEVWQGSRVWNGYYPQRVDGEYWLFNEPTRGDRFYYTTDGATPAEILFSTRDIPFGFAGPVTELVATEDRVFVLTPDFELGIFDGTPEGSRIVFDGEGPTSSYDAEMGRLGPDRVVFLAYHDSLQFPNNGASLWVSDGTEEGTELIRDSGQGGMSLAPQNFARVGNRTVFIAFDPEFGRELWVTDGTKDGTKLLADVNPGAESSFYFNTSSTARNGTYTDGTTAFVFHEIPIANRGVITVSDGTLEGTHSLSLPENTFVDTRRRTFNQVVGGRAFFEAGNVDDGYVTWTSDGTEEGTHPVETGLPAGHKCLGVFAEHIFCTYKDDTGLSVWSIPTEPREDRTPGDVDGDGQVTFADFLVLSTNFGNEQASREQGDLDNDGRVSFADFLILAANFGF